MADIGIGLVFLGAFIYGGLCQIATAIKKGKVSHA
jgi:hypothetical protein